MTFNRLKCRSVYHTKHHMTSKCSQVMQMDYLWYLYDTFLLFLSIFVVDSHGFYIFCGDSLKKMHLLYSKSLFYSFKGIWQINPTHHPSAKQSFWVSNILKFLTLDISIWHFDIFRHTMHSVITCYDVNGKWRNCCPKQPIFKIWIEMPLFFHSPPFPL